MSRQLPADFFKRIDDDDDEVFYSAGRLVVHIDDAAIAKVGGIDAQIPPQRGAFLDLMSSFMESGAFENMDFIDRSAPAAPPPDPVWAMAGDKATGNRRDGAREKRHDA
ncbi:hypothetical protein [Candidatus Binatus sp.]|uniref:hypothetical protein n=1 Tax=Candidatus Binatus sp. TaxID=2811406 RepID=UPI002F95FF14